MYLSKMGKNVETFIFPLPVGIAVSGSSRWMLESDFRDSQIWWRVVLLIEPVRWAWSSIFGSAFVKIELGVSIM